MFFLLFTLSMEAPPYRLSLEAVHSSLVVQGLVRTFTGLIIGGSYSNHFVLIVTACFTNSVFFHQEGCVRGRKGLSLSIARWLKDWCICNSRVLSGRFCSPKFSLKMTTFAFVRRILLHQFVNKATLRRMESDQSSLKTRTNKWRHPWILMPRSPFPNSMHYWNIFFICI